jgi:hypothetical protein
MLEAVRTAEAHCVLYGKRHKKLHIYSIIFDLLKHICPESLTREEVEQLIPVVFQHARPQKDRVRDVVKAVLATHLESFLPPDFDYIAELKDALLPPEIPRLLSVLSDDSFQKQASRAAEQISRLSPEVVSNFLLRCMACDVDLQPDTIPELLDADFC